MGLSALLYGPWLLTAGFTPRGDVLRQSVPWLSFAREQIWTGRMPAWDPARLAGTPHLANIQAGSFYPPNWLLLVGPADTGAVLSLVGHVTLGGALLTLLGRSLGLQPAPAALVGAAYVAGGFVTARVYAGHLEVLRTLAWTPLLLLAARELALHGRPHWAGMLAAASSLSLLAGYPAVTVYSLGAAGVLFLATLPEGRRRVRGVLLGAVAMGLTPLVCAPTLWPLWELARQTTRSAGLDLSVAAVGALRPSDLPTLLWPWYFGSGPLESYWRGPGWFWHETQTAGGLAVSALALVGAAAYRRDRRVWLLLALGVGSLLLSLGTLTPAYTLLHEALPFLRLFRIPARFSLVWSLVIPLLAGFGLQALLERRPGALGLVIRLGVVASITALLGLGLLRVLAPRGIPSASPDAALLLERVPMATAAGGLNVLLGLLALGGLALMGRMWRRGRVHARPLALGVSGVVLLELSLLALPSIHSSPESLPRLLATLGDENVRTLRSSPYRVALEGQLKAYANVGDVLGFQSVTAYDPLLLERTTALLRASQGNIPEPFGSGSNYITLQKDGGTAFDVLGVGHLVLNTSPQATVVPRAEPLGRLTLVPRARLVAGSGESLAAVLAPGFDPRREVVLEHDAPTLQASSRGGGSHVEILEDRPGLLRARVETADEAYLLFSESYYTGWWAEASGQRVALVAANHAVMAVRLGPGTHDLALRFTTPWLIPSLGLSLAGIVGICVLLFARRERQGAEHA